MRSRIGHWDNDPLKLRNKTTEISMKNYKINKIYISCHKKYVINDK